jgi:dTMP kinase
MLAERLSKTSIEAICTREPGGSPGAEAIRSLLVTGEIDRWSPTSETLLLYAARRDHIERTIGPALERGHWVICDRFADSTRAYQGAAGGTSEDLIAALEAAVLMDRRPDLTLIFDLPPEVGLSRAAGRGGAEARFEAKGLDFHARLRARFLQIAQAEPERCVVIDAQPNPDQVEQAVWTAVSGRLL